MMAVMDKASLARLAFWGMNMNVATGGRNNWPGFRYTPAEWARLTKLSEAVDGGAFVKFVLTVAVVFIVLAACAVVGILVPILIALYPNPADLQPLPFVLLLAAITFIAIGAGLPISLRVGAWASRSDAMLARLREEAGDAAIAAKAAHQITRMTVIMCGLLVPGVLIWIAFDIQGGPIITALKWLAIGLMGSSAVYTVVTRKR
jgi:hypothetical protein